MVTWGRGGLWGRLLSLWGHVESQVPVGLRRRCPELVGKPHIVGIIPACFAFGIHGVCVCGGDRERRRWLLTRQARVRTVGGVKATAPTLGKSPLNPALWQPPRHGAKTFVAEIVSV